LVSIYIDMESLIDYIMTFLKQRKGCMLAHMTNCY
jgi:hypothetical protein